MTRTLRVLHVDRSVADAERIKAELERGGVKVLVERVETEADFSTALQDFSPDVVLCDHANEHLDAKTALRAVQLLRPAVPVILVPGALDDHTAVCTLRAGAEDIVSKRNLSRLAGAIEAALAVRRRLKRLTPRQLEVLQLVAVVGTL